MTIRAIKNMFHGQVGTANWKILFVNPADDLTYVLQDLTIPQNPGVFTLAEVDATIGAAVGGTFAGPPTAAEKIIVITGTDSIGKMNYPISEGKMLVAISTVGNATAMLQGVVAR